MWTCDVIEALNALEKKYSHPIVLKGIQFHWSGEYILLTTSGERVYCWDIHTKEITVTE